MNATNSQSPTIVLVHGALTDASVWHGVIRLTQAAGHHVVAPSLPLRGLASDAAYLASFLESVPGPIVLVAHSYAGSVISHPATLDPKVKALVFIAAFQPDAGESSAELNEKFPGSKLGPATTTVVPRPGGNDMYLKPEAFGEVYAGDVAPDVVSAMAAAQRPIDPAALGETLPARATWHDLPSWALVSTRDLSLPPQLLGFTARRAESHIVEVESSHAVPVSHPREVTEVVLEAVRCALS
ncbi:alpha/beta fold hydrolase [Streptomyces xanthochromogenes]